MFGAYDRTHSIFQNSDMMAKGPPGPEELALLEPFRGKVPDEVFGEPFVPPVSDGSGQDRALLRKAGQLLTDAGIVVKDGKRVLQNGQRLTIEFLIDEATFEPHHMLFIKNLGIVGIEASLRQVDPVQFKKREDDFDFDIVVQRASFSSTPGDFAAHLLLGRRSRATRLAKPRRGCRPCDRRDDRADHRGQQPAGAGHRLSRARPLVPRRTILDSAVVQSIALDRVLGRFRTARDKTALCARRAGNLVVRPGQGNQIATGRIGVSRRGWACPGQPCLYGADAGKG